MRDEGAGESESSVPEEPVLEEPVLEEPVSANTFIRTDTHLHAST